MDKIEVSLGFYFTPDEIAARLMALKKTNAASLPEFLAMAAGVMRAISWRREYFKPDVLYQSLKCGLSEELHNCHSQADFLATGRPDRSSVISHPKHSITWKDVEELIQWVRSQFANRRRLRPDPGVANAGQAGAGTSGRSSPKMVAAASTPEGPSGPPLNVNVATMESVQEMLTHIQKTIEGRKNLQLVGQLSESPELGARRPAALTPAATPRPSPTPRAVSFDDEAIPAGIAASAGGGGRSLKVSAAYPASRRNRGPPPGAELSDCYQFFQTGSCKFGDACKYNHRSAASATPEEVQEMRQIAPTVQRLSGATPPAKARAYLSTQAVLFPFVDSILEDLYVYLEEEKGDGGVSE